LKETQKKPKHSCLIQPSKKDVPSLDFLLTPTMRALKSSGSYSPREAPAQPQQRRVVLCPQSDNLLQTLKRLAQRKDVRVTMQTYDNINGPELIFEPLTR